MSSYWQRCIKDAGPGVQARFKESLELFFEAVNIQAQDRDAGVIPDLESYIDMRRDTSGCKPVFDLIEYALRIDLPDSVVENPVIRALNQSSNDLVTWSNVCIRTGSTRWCDYVRFWCLGPFCFCSYRHVADASFFV